MTEFIQINTTSDKKETLQSIATRLVERKLAACVQIGGPIESVYRWQGKIETDTEWTCSIKTVVEHQTNVEKQIHELHHYDEPQVIVFPIIGGSKSYLDWVRAETTA